MKAQANGVELEYETFGKSTDPAVLLIMGLGAQLTLWPEALCEKLAGKGFFVIRYDNRDVGLSTKFDAAGAPDMAQIFGGTAKPHYTLDDMAADAAGLLDALKIEKAHIVGASMGGMIAQLVAANHPERTLSLTSIMSTTGNPALPPSTPEAMQALTARLPADASIEAMIDNSVKTLTVIGSPAHDYGAPEERAAIIANGDRREKLKGVTAPTTVIHGEVDPLVPLAGGKDTAASIEGAELVVIPGMGHDLPPFVLDQVANAIATTAARAD
jgi:pimeloyl-ACP methyl ester carboxylesterase